MLLGDRLRALREAKRLSQRDIEERTGLLRCYVSRVENGHTVPGIDTLEKWAQALEIPMHQLFYDDEIPPSPPECAGRTWEVDQSGRKDKPLLLINKFRRSLERMGEFERKLLRSVAVRIAAKSKTRPKQ